LYFVGRMLYGPIYFGGGKAMTDDFTRYRLSVIELRALLAHEQYCFPTKGSSVEHNLRRRLLLLTGNGDVAIVINALPVDPEDT
jgi:hypothetical protein